MDLVVDANILFSSLIKDGKTSELLFEEELKLYTPEFIMEEFKKYEEILLKKTHRTKEQFHEILQLIKEIITIIPKEEYLNDMKKAKEISPDPKDAMYLALALKLKCSVWSNDKKLKEQKEVRIYSTEEINKIV